MNPATTEANRKRLRRQYINNLNLEAKNDKTNYTANKILQITGEEPVQPPDMRSIEEKEKDLLNLKTLVRSQLMEITDGSNANQIVDSLSNDGLVFVANHMPYLIQELKPRFALGIPALIFLNYVKELMRLFEYPLHQEYGQTNQTPEPSTGEESMDIDDDDLFFDASGPPSSLPPPSSSSSSSKRKTDTEQERPKKKPAVIPTAEGPFSMGATPKPSKRGRPAKSKPATTSQQGPFSGPFTGEIPLPTAGTKRGRPIIIDDDRPSRKKRVLSRPAFKSTPASTAEPISFSMGATPKPSAKRKRGRPAKSTKPQATPQQGPFSGPFSGEIPLPKAGTKRSRPIIIDDDRQPRKKRVIKRPAFRPTPAPEAGPFSDDFLPPAGVKRSRSTGATAERPMKKHSTGPFLGENPLIPAGTKRRRVIDDPKPNKRQKIVGRGLAPRISVDTEARGVAKSKRYIPFGRYAINQHKLKNTDIMMIKTMKGGAIAHLPTVKVSNPLSGLMQKMIDGHMPTFDDINNLSVDDKQQLHHVTRKCDIDVSVPNPDKDKLSQEMNRFDILKGEILAGNDNKEMVREFKVMLLRFMNNGRIPRRQGQEILTDLASIGY